MSDDIKLKDQGRLVVFDVLYVFRLIFKDLYIVIKVLTLPFTLYFILKSSKSLQEKDWNDRK